MTTEYPAGFESDDIAPHVVDLEPEGPDTTRDEPADRAGDTPVGPVDGPADDELEGFDEPDPIDLGDGPTEPAEPFVPTGEPRVDDAVARLADLDGSPTGEHVGVLEDVHRRLHEALSDLGTER